MKEIIMLNKKVLILIMISVFLVLTGCTDQEEGLETEEFQENDEIVAIVNDEEIKRSEFDALLESKLMGYQQQGLDIESDEGVELKEQLRAETIDDLVNMRVLIQGAEKEGFEASSDQVEEQLQAIKQQFEVEEEFEEALVQNNITLEELEKQIADQIKMDQFTSEKVGEVTVSEEEMEEFYDEFSKNAEDVPEFEELLPQIEQQLTQEKTNEQMDVILQELKNESEIEILMNI